MITKKLQTLFLFSIPLFIAHGLEEYFTGFYLVDPIFKFALGPLLTLPTSQATFLLFQLMLWLLLIISYIILKQGRALLIFMTFIGLIFIFELHHLLEAIFSMNYYPGTLTALLFPILGFFYWKELIQNWKKR
ncbi:MAG TPA: HXXEE domain-containing protein [Candidatus Nanoarchaeia archaeon]|nr:HXXEE domain-containing protein [Candidatus Nanoarchaeia archaeon]